MTIEYTKLIHDFEQCFQIIHKNIASISEQDYLHEKHFSKKLLNFSSTKFDKCEVTPIFRTKK